MHFVKFDQVQKAKNKDGFLKFRNKTLIRNELLSDNIFEDHVELSKCLLVTNRASNCLDVLHQVQRGDDQVIFGCIEHRAILM